MTRALNYQELKHYATGVNTELGQCKNRLKENSSSNNKIFLVRKKDV